MKKTLQFLLSGLLALNSLTAFGQTPYLYKNIDINNINAIISPSTDLFWDFTNSTFEVPKGGGVDAIFCGSLWIGGLDPGGNIHMAGQLYNQTGNDAWPGPIDTVHFTPGGPANYLDYNEPWKVSQAEIDNHILNYTNAGYVVPANIAAWPGFDTTVQRVLAPFADYNSNGIYDPQNGDYPYILGDQSVYAVYNDWYPHTCTTCDFMGVEVHREFFGFDEPSIPELNNSIFSRYEIKNFNTVDYHDVYISIWTDFDLGFATDDYIGTDIGLDMVYAYNADSIDGTPPGYGYGANPPAIGVYFLNQNLFGSVSYDNVNNLPTGNPNGCFDFRNYALSIWMDNQPVTYGADGRDPSAPVTTFMYPGTTDTVNFPILGEWSEVSAGNAPEDRRALATIGPFNLPSKSVISFDMGYTWARAIWGGPMASVMELQNAVSNLRVMYNNGLLTSVPAQIQSNPTQFEMYPNPASDLLTIENKSTDKSFEILIQDAVGRIVYQKQNVKDAIHHIDLRGISDGIYFVTMIQDNKMLNQKLIIK